MKFKYDKDKEELVLTEATQIEHHQLNLWLTRYIKSYKFHPLVKKGLWDGKKSYFKSGKIKLGLWKECYLASKEIGVKFEIENKEDFPLERSVTLESVKEFCYDFFKDHKVKNENGEWIPFIPYDYQIETAFKILKNRMCIAEVATSGGKSLMISIVFFYIKKFLNPDVKMLFIVPNINLVNQFYNDIITYYYGENNLDKIIHYNIEIDLEDGTTLKLLPNDILNTKRGLIKSIDLKEKDKLLDYTSKIKRIIKIKVEHELRIEEIMSDTPRVYHGDDEPNIYIGCYQSLIKFPKDFFKQFYAVAIDEAHLSKGDSISKIAERTFTHAYYRFGVSGTFPSDTSLEILSIQYLTGPKIAKIDAKELMTIGTVTPVQIYSLILNHNEPELHKKLKSARGPDNGSIIYNYEKNFIQQSEKRLNFIYKLVKEKCKNNTMVLFHNIEYGKRIYDKLSSIEDIEVYYIDGDVNAKDRKRIIAEMKKTNCVKILVSSYGTTSTGLSINSIFNMVFADSFKSDSLITQSIGRALRKFDGKNIATIYDLVDIFTPDDMSNILYRQYIEREEIYRKRQYPFTIKKVNI